MLQDAYQAAHSVCNVMVPDGAVELMDALAEPVNGYHTCYGHRRDPFGLHGASTWLVSKGTGSTSGETLVRITIIFTTLGGPFFPETEGQVVPPAPRLIIINPAGPVTARART